MHRGWGANFWDKTKASVNIIRTNLPQKENSLNKLCSEGTALGTQNEILSRLSALYNAYADIIALGDFLNILVIILLPKLEWY